MNLLLFAENSTNFSSIVLPALVISLFVIYIAFGFIKRSKINAETHNLFEKLQVGVKIKTYSGIYGEIVEIRDALDGSKVVFCIIEWIRKKPIDKKIENNIHTIGFFVLMGLVLMADLYQVFFANIFKTLFG